MLTVSLKFKAAIAIFGMLDAILSGYLLYKVLHILNFLDINFSIKIFTIHILDYTTYEFLCNYY